MSLLFYMPLYTVQCTLSVHASVTYSLYSLTHRQGSTNLNLLSLTLGLTLGLTDSRATLQSYPTRHIFVHFSASTFMATYLHDISAVLQNSIII